MIMFLLKAIAIVVLLCLLLMVLFGFALLAYAVTRTDLWRAFKAPFDKEDK